MTRLAVSASFRVPAAALLARFYFFRAGERLGTAMPVFPMVARIGLGSGRGVGLRLRHG